MMGLNARMFCTQSSGTLLMSNSTPESQKNGVLMAFIRFFTSLLSAESGLNMMDTRSQNTNISTRRMGTCSRYTSSPMPHRK